MPTTSPARTCKDTSDTRSRGEPGTVSPETSSRTSPISPADREKRASGSCPTIWRTIHAVSVPVMGSWATRAPSRRTVT